MPWLVQRATAEAAPYSRSSGCATTQTARSQSSAIGCMSLPPAREAGRRVLPPRLPFNPVPRLSGVSCGVVLSGVQAIRYVTPLREGGSLPAVMEADDVGTYVVKFRGAGQGRAALVAEVISAGIARACGLAVPDLVAVSLDPALAPGEPDQEIQDLLRASGGLNLGVDFLPGALDFETGAATVDPGLAGRIIWFDALISNADRSWRNPNMLLWHGRLYLIDHGATLTFHHRWASARRGRRPAL